MRALKAASVAVSEGHTVRPPNSLMPVCYGFGRGWGGATVCVLGIPNLPGHNNSLHLPFWGAKRLS